MQDTYHGPNGCHDFVADLLPHVFDQAFHERFEVLEVEFDLIPFAIQSSFTLTFTRGYARELGRRAAIRGAARGQRPPSKRVIGKGYLQGALPFTEAYYHVADRFW